jgi:hypothetical protein
MVVYLSVTSMSATRKRPIFRSKKGRQLLVYKDSRTFRRRRMRKNISEDVPKVTSMSFLFSFHETKCFEGNSRKLVECVLVLIKNFLRSC